MRFKSKTVCVTLLCFALSSPVLKAQTAQKDSLILDSASALALHQYHTYISPATDLYRGPEYVEYRYQIKDGHPYFLDSLIEGAILYNGILYENIPLLFDEVLDLVVIKDPYEVWRLSLNREHVDSFTIGDHRFVRLGDSLNPSAPRNGYYEQLYRGKVRLLKRESKTIQVQASFLNQVFEKYTLTSTSYWFRKGETYYAVNNQRSLLAALKDKSKEAKKFMRSNHLRIRKDKQNTLVKVITWYDGLPQ
jgi:hypothetical protein